MFRFKLKSPINEVFFENSISPWSILKELEETPYLKSYLVKNYDGGNSMVPEEAWKEEGILYQKIQEGVYIFPYESIGFVLDDSINNVDITVLDKAVPNNINPSEFVFRYIVENLQTTRLLIYNQTDKISVLAALYLFSKMKIGFDNDILRSVEKCIRPLINSNTKGIEFVESSLSFGLKGMKFIIQVSTDDKELFYTINCKRKCKKSPLKENQIRNLGYLKKKIMLKSPVFPIIYVLFLILSVFLLYKWIGMSILALLILFLILKGCYSFIRKRLPLILKKTGFLKFQP